MTLCSDVVSKGHDKRDDVGRLQGMVESMLRKLGMASIEEVMI